jgi:cyclopropane-fatty-acyl-phospholipid synthase
MVATWDSWASLIKRLPFSDTVIGASTDLARTIVLSQLRGLEHGALVILDVDGSKHSFGSTTSENHLTASIEPQRRAPDILLQFHSSYAWTRILFANDIGFSEAYMLSEVSCNDLTGFFRLCILNAAVFSANFSLLSSVTSLVTSPLYRLSNTAEQALLNAQNHYSLSNDMFAAFLDPTMMYSAPLWLPLSDPASATESLETAQLRKLHYTITAARIVASDHVLEIGTGWGSFAIEAVRQTGCRVTTLTASSEQAILARERIREAGYEQKIEVLVCDYRLAPLPDTKGGKYDKIVSIEMIEHVGEKYLDTYFQCMDRYLKTDGGIGVFQVITMPEPRYEGYKTRTDFMQRYIFPGGHLPTVSGMVASIDRASKGNLVVEDIKSVSGHYVKALRLWRENFLKSWDTLIKPGLKEKMPNLTTADMNIFRRKWEYYFSYCEAGFVTKTLGDVSITVGREGATALIDDVPI